MRLHRLELTAFGPFAGTEVIDLDDVGSAGLFLLHGPTGAGKTSVLDAVCFALFGQVPGSRGSARQRLRSDHAPSDRRPQVLLELTVGGRRLEVARSPEWQRPKRRGSGTTKAQASTTVRELVDGEWRPLTSRNDEAGHLLTRLIGMGVEQFTKVVLLPQGDFAAFLRADADTRRVLLSRLFDIDLYTDVESWLGDERRRLARAVDEADQRTATLVSRAVEASTGLPADEGDEIPEETKPLLVVGHLMHRAEVASRAGEAELVLREEQLAAARHALAAGTATAGLQERWTVASARLLQLETVALDVQRDRRRLDAARRAAPLGPLLAARSDALVRWCEAATSVLQLVDARHLDAAALDALTTLSSDRQAAAHESLVAELPAARTCDADRSSLQRRLALVEAALERSEAYSDLRGTTDRLVAAVASSDQARSQVELALGRARNAVELAAAQLDVARADVPDLVAREEAVERARTSWEHARIAASLADQLVAAQGRLREAVDADQYAREHVLQVRERRLDGIAAELAMELRPGCPCPVCGSAEHPLPSRATDEQVDRADEQQATDTADAARAAREEAAADLGILQSRSAEAAALSGGLTEVLAQTALEAAELQLQEAHEHHSRLGQTAAAHDEATAQADTLLSRLGALTSQRSTAEAELAEARGRLDALEQHLHAVLAEALESSTDGLPVLGAAETVDRLQALQAQSSVEIERLRDLSRARLELDAAHDDHEALHTRARATAAACGFADVDEAAAALLPDEAMQELAESVAAYDAGHVEVQAELARPEVLEASTRATPDLARLQQDVGAADSLLRRATAAGAVAERSTSSLRRIQAELAAHELTSDEVRQTHARIDELSRCVDGTGGGNSLRMRLSAYVLAARLEQVAAAATERLDVMSGGRYALVHSDEVAKGGGRSGLSLRVVDGWTGVDRDTATLSGGESFLASLALALGLADVVQAEAGGASIETLFVDEGFGTLDDETLDEVMTVLDGLRDGGRTVGVVSHVAELRHRIPNRIEVVKRRDGSRLVVHDTCA
jgi:exonuclease SbcC